MIKEYYKQLHANKLDKREQILETHQVLYNLRCNTKSQ